MEQQNTTVFEITVSADEDGQRLDQFLVQTHNDTLEHDSPPKLSRTRWSQLIEQGFILRNDISCIKPAARIKSGDTLSITIPPAEAMTLQPENIPLTVLFEDEHILVIDKPAGLVVHPAPGHWSGTLVNAILYHCKGQLSGIGGVQRPGIVHRLDKDTSGVMVISKSDIAHEALSQQFAAHGRDGKLERRYLALTIGSPDREHGTINAPIGRDPHNRLRMAINGSGAREAITHWECLEHFGAHSALIACTLETGRTHQIRVHMNSIGLPLIGDPQYGLQVRTKLNIWPEPAKSAAMNYPYQALHATFLGFEHPISKEKLKFETAMPVIMAGLLEALKSSNK